MRALKLIGQGLIGLVILVMVAISLLLAYRAVRQQQNGQAIAIHTANGIDEKLWVTIGGIEQYVEIRGQDRSNPVLLVLHGGPGTSLVPITYRMFLPLEKQFTVVNWDQRGAGRTYGRNGVSEAPTVTLPRMEQDTLELADYLRARLHKDRIGILAASGGSTFGLMFARHHPEKLYAYVGTGQVIDVKDAYQDTYDYALASARKDHNAAAVAEITAAGPPPWQAREADQRVSKWLAYYSAKSEKDFTAESHILPLILFAPGYSLEDFKELLDGGAFTQKCLEKAFQTYDVRTYGLGYGTNMFFFQGDEDHRTPTKVVQAFLDSITAPHKEMVILPGGAHTAALALPELFIKGMIERVRPFGVRAEQDAARAPPPPAAGK